MLTSISGKSVLVTGGSKGIGKGIARVFARQGAKVTIAARNLEGAEAAAEELRAAGGTAAAVSADVGKSEDCDAMAKAAAEAHGGLHAGRACGAKRRPSAPHIAAWISSVPMPESFRPQSLRICLPSSGTKCWARTSRACSSRSRLACLT